jgi:hypothetical protein
MIEAHYSFVICGSDERRWAAYAFDAINLDDADLDEKIFPYEGFHADPIVSAISRQEIDADFPIWSPREYFITVIANRIARVTREWEALL